MMMTKIFVSHVKLEINAGNSKTSDTADVNDDAVVARLLHQMKGLSTYMNQAREVCLYDLFNVIENLIIGLLVVQNVNVSN